MKFYLPQAANVHYSSFYPQNYMSMVSSKLIPRIGILLTCYFLSLFSLKAQHAFGEDPIIWIRSNDLEQNYTVDELNYLGNYPVLDLTANSIAAVFEELVKENDGTLFLAGRFPKEERLIEFGKVSVSNNHVEAGQHNIVYEPLTGSGSIIKVSYNISPKYKKPDYKLFIHEGVQIAELLFFRNGHTEEECRKVESYLALKYSVNITQNTDNELRHYVNPNETRVWDFPIDALYDEEVIGLGRCDELMFNQTQTLSADAESIRLSFSMNSMVGYMPNVNLENNSYLILSKKNESLTRVQCGGTPSIKPWKLKLHNWSTTNPDEAYLWLDTNITTEFTPIITDGLVAINLKAESINSGIRMTLPLKELDFKKDYFIVWNFVEEGCNPLATVKLELCDEASNQPNTLLIEVDDEGISSQITLHNQSSGEHNQYDLYQNKGIVSGLPEGQYELIVTHDNLVLVDQVFHCGKCDDVTANSSMSFTQSNNDEGNLYGTSGTQGIRAYPNPVGENSSVLFQFWGFDNQVFDIQITDQTGKIMDNQSFQLDEGNTWTCQFKDVGVYNVRISNANFTEVKRIIVQ